MQLLKDCILTCTTTESSPDLKNGILLFHRSAQAVNQYISLAEAISAVDSAFATIDIGHTLVNSLLDMVLPSEITLIAIFNINKDQRLKQYLFTNNVPGGDADASLC